MGPTSPEVAINAVPRPAAIKPVDYSSPGASRESRLIERQNRWAAIAENNKSYAPGSTAQIVDQESKKLAADAIAMANIDASNPDVIFQLSNHLLPPSSVVDQVEAMEVLEEVLIAKRISKDNARFLAIEKMTDSIGDNIQAENILAAKGVNKEQFQARLIELKADPNIIAIATDPLTKLPYEPLLRAHAVAELLDEKMSLQERQKHAAQTYLADTDKPFTQFSMGRDITIPGTQITIKSGIHGPEDKGNAKDNIVAWAGFFRGFLPGGELIQTRGDQMIKGMTEMSGQLNAYGEAVNNLKPAAKAKRDTDVSLEAWNSVDSNFKKANSDPSQTKVLINTDLSIAQNNLDAADQLLSKARATRNPEKIAIARADYARAQMQFDVAVEAKGQVDRYLVTPDKGKEVGILEANQKTATSNYYKMHAEFSVLEKRIGEEANVKYSQGKISREVYQQFMNLHEIFEKDDGQFEAFMNNAEIAGRKKKRKAIDELTQMLLIIFLGPVMDEMQQVA